MMPAQLIAQSHAQSHDGFDLLAIRCAIESDLRGNILPFWMRHVVDPESGRFFGALGNDLTVDATVERGALLSSRILWTYAAASRRYDDPAYRAMADRAHADLMTCFFDLDHGGFFWSVAADGGVTGDRKQIYGQAFALYALSEYHAATGDQAALDEAVSLFRRIENTARDAKLGGYLEAFGRDWTVIADMRLSALDLNAPKSQNTLLHVMEAYTNLLRVWPDEGLRRALADLVGIMLHHVVDAQSGHLRLFFNTEWQPLSDRISYGHDIEAAWLLTDAATVLGDPALIARIETLAVRIADTTLSEGVDDDGALFYEGGPNGITNADKEWWPQAEAVIGFLNAFQISGERRFLNAALRTWRFIAAHLIDRQHGEWFRAAARDGTVHADALKVSFWKCPYHNGRMGLEAVRRLDHATGLTSG